MALFVLTTFLSAFLLFQVQLMLAKYLLAWFGGAASVWTACMLFFQTVLLCGYGYSHVLATRVAPRRRGGLHAALLAVSLVLLAGQWIAWHVPVLPGPGLKPAPGGQPFAGILMALAVGIGFQFFMLSTTSSLMQAWFAKAFPGRSPYRLYALSNGGSLLGVLAYPFIVQPMLGLRAQAFLWAGGYAVFVACSMACAIRAVGLAGVSAPSAGGPASAPGAGEPDGVQAASWGKILLWAGLSACGNVIFLGTTSEITEEISSNTLLWGIPLALYLLSFILCFGSGKFYHRGVFAALWLIAAAMLQWTMDHGNMGTFSRQAIYWFALFIGCSLCHGELAQARPPAGRLTLFYVAVAAGGAAGGLAVLLVAPVVFGGIWELHIGYLCATLVIAAGFVRDQRARGGRAGLLGGMAILAVTAVFFCTLFVLERASTRLGVVAVRRNFYGIMRVVETGSVRRLVHASTMHGAQYRDYGRRRVTTTYYTEDSGVGIALRGCAARKPAGLRVGAVGLGAGTIAAYGRTGDYYCFYEINPANLELAVGPDALFSYVGDSRARVDVKLGDARLLLEREPSEAFDVLVLDAFSGGSTPVHLLTIEAFNIYLRCLKPGGVLAVHLTNKYLDLEPVVWKVAGALGLSCVDIYSRAVETRASSADWMLLSRDADLLGQLTLGNRAATTRPSGPVVLGRAWTDDNNSVLRLIRLKSRDAAESRQRGVR